jgi:hypothetical protein
MGKYGALPVDIVNQNEVKWVKPKRGLSFISQKNLLGRAEWTKFILFLFPGYRYQKNVFAQCDATTKRLLQHQSA